MMVRVIEQERGTTRTANDAAGEAGDAASGARVSTRLSPAELAEELERREALLQQGGVDGEETDQWRVYTHIVGKLHAGEYLRLMVQASAGTGS